MKRRSSSGCDGRSEARTQGVPIAAIGTTEDAASGRAARPDGQRSFRQTLLLSKNSVRGLNIGARAADEAALCPRTGRRTHPTTRDRSPLWPRPSLRPTSSSGWRGRSRSSCTRWSAPRTGPTSAPRFSDPASRHSWGRFPLTTRLKRPGKPPFTRTTERRTRLPAQGWETVSRWRSSTDGGL